jgi:hypothetical protein
VAQAMAREGRAVSATIALSESDYTTIDHVVRAMSAGRYTAAKVTWNGRPLSCHVAAVAA